MAMPYRYSALGTQENPSGTGTPQINQQAVMYSVVIAWIVVYWTLLLSQAPEHAKEFFDEDHAYLVWIVNAILLIFSFVGIIVLCRQRCHSQRTEEPTPAQDCAEELPLDPEQMTCLQRMKRYFRELKSAAEEHLNNTLLQVQRRLEPLNDFIRLGAMRFNRFKLSGEMCFNEFKRSGLGIFLLERYLKIQDMGSDLWITFKPDGGLFWGADWWWGHISVFLIANTFVLMFVLTTPIFTKQISRKLNIPTCASVVLWVLVGPIAVLLMDLYMLFRFPCFEPRLGWLSNVFRLQKLTETVVEAPAQLVLQLWIFVSRTFIDKRDDFRFPFSLCFSIGTSALSLFLSLQDVKATANAEGITFFECLVDLAFVSLGRRAPLIHQLCVREHVIYDDEGALTEQHLEEICRVAQGSTKLKSLSLSPSNEFTPAAFQKLLDMGLEIHVDGRRFFMRREPRDGEPEPSFVFFAVPPEGFGRLFQSAQHVEVLFDSGFGAVGCERLRELPQLPSLKIGVGNRIGPDGCRHLKELQRLTKLIIADGNNISAEGCRHLKELRELTDLTLLDNEVGAEGCSHLKELRGLTSLEIWGSIGAEGCMHLKELRDLTRLIIRPSNHVGAAGLRHLRDLPQLRELTVREDGNDIDSDDAEALLEELRGRGVQVRLPWI